MNINSLHSQACDGDRAAEKQLFSVLTERFLVITQQRISNRQDCQEVVQETLMTIASRYRTIDFTKSFSAWSYKVLENKIGDYHRASKVRKKRFAQTESGTADTSLNPDPTLKASLLTCLEKVVRAYPRHARILNLRYLGFNIDEICDKLGITPNTAYVLLCRARAKLKSCLEGKDDDK